MIVTSYFKKFSSKKNTIDYEPPNKNLLGIFTSNNNDNLVLPMTSSENVEESEVNTLFNNIIN